MQYKCLQYVFFLLSLACLLLMLVAVTVHVTLAHRAREQLVFNACNQFHASRRVKARQLMQNSRLPRKNTVTHRNKQQRTHFYSGHFVKIIYKPMARHQTLFSNLKAYIISNEKIVYVFMCNNQYICFVSY